jgi:hypothetical protein
MGRLRIKNATLFVTVLGACLGLVAAGASSQAHRTTTSFLSELATRSGVTVSYRYNAKQALKLTSVYNSPARALASGSESSAALLLYQNTNPLTATRHILVVTTLARASLEALPA